MTIQEGDRIIMMRTKYGGRISIPCNVPEVDQKYLMLPIKGGGRIAQALTPVEYGDKYLEMPTKTRPISLGHYPPPPRPSPSLSSFSPPTARRGKTYSFDLYGSNLTGPPGRVGVHFLNDLDAPFGADSISSVSSSKVEGEFTVPDDAELGLWDVRYRNNRFVPPDTATLEDALTILRSYWLTDVEDRYVEDIHNHWASHDLIGYYLHMLTGLLEGEKFKILDNTASTAFYLKPPVVGISNGDFASGWDNWRLCNDLYSPASIKDGEGWEDENALYSKATSGSVHRLTFSHAQPTGYTKIYFKYKFTTTGNGRILQCWSGSCAHKANIVTIFSGGHNPSYPDWDTAEYTFIPYGENQFGVDFWDSRPSTHEAWFSHFTADILGPTCYEMGFRILDEYQVEDALGNMVEAEF